MIAWMTARHRDGHVIQGPLPGPAYNQIDRTMLKSVDVLWGNDREELEGLSLEVPLEVRLVMRRRRGINLQVNGDMMDLQIVALESKDRTWARVFVLFMEHGMPMLREQDGWGGPNLWPPELYEEEL
jgi:hypothetical protein